ncbi:MAG: hypothetical protein WC526_03745 [Patescibacteria group bacterium]
MENITQKFSAHDKKFDQIDKRFDQIDKKLEAHDKRFDQVDKRFDQVDKRFDFLAIKFLEHDERLDRIEADMATKTDLNKISITLDKLVQITEKKDQELTIATHDMRIIEGRVEVLEEDMKQVKPALGLT